VAERSIRTFAVDAGASSVVYPCRSVPIPFACPFGLALGAVFAWIAAPELARVDASIVASRPFAVVAAFAAFVWIPVVGYFVAFHADWSYVYWLPSQRVPSAIDLVLVAVAGAAVVAGFSVAVAPVRKRRVVPVVVLVVAPLVVTITGLTAAAHRLAVSGTYAQFHGEFGTEPIGASALGKGVLLMGTVLALGIAWTARSLAVMSSAGGS
jgi:hypothetical protein